MEPGTRPHSRPAAQGLSAWGRSAPWKEVPSSPGRRGVNPLGSAPSAGCTAPATPRRQPRPRGPGPGRCRQPATSRSRGGPGPASTARGPHPSVPACATDPAPRPTGPLARARMPTVEGLLPRGPAGLSPRAACRHLPPPQSGCHQKVTMGRPPPNTPGRNVPGHVNGGRNPTPTHAVPCASRVRPATLVKLMPRAATGPRAAGARWVQRAGLPGSPRA